MLAEDARWRRGVMSTKTHLEFVPVKNASDTKLPACRRCQRAASMLMDNGRPWCSWCNDWADAKDEKKQASSRLAQTGVPRTLRVGLRCFVGCNVSVDGGLINTFVTTKSYYLTRTIEVERPPSGESTCEIRCDTCGKRLTLQIGDEKEMQRNLRIFNWVLAGILAAVCAWSLFNWHWAFTVALALGVFLALLLAYGVKLSALDLLKIVRDTRAQAIALSANQRVQLSLSSGGIDVPITSRPGDTSPEEGEMQHKLVASEQ